VNPCVTTACFTDESFDVVLDKSLIDTLMCFKVRVMSLDAPLPRFSFCLCEACEAEGSLSVPTKLREC
jgi:hypothetical protein